MSTSSLSRDEVVAFVEAYLQAVADGYKPVDKGCGLKSKKPARMVAADRLSLTRNEVDGRLRYARLLGLLPDPTTQLSPETPLEKPRIRVKAGSDRDLPQALHYALDPLEQRRAADIESILRERVKILERELIAERAWHSKMDSAHRTRLEPVEWMPTPHIRSRRTVLVPVLFTSDFHVGEVIKAEEVDGINDYNQDIFCERYQRMIDKTIEIAENNTGANEYPYCIYLRGGDAISGEIHEELAETNDLSSIPAVRTLQRQEREGIRKLREKFGRVRVISIPGNHGRTTKKSHAKGYAERSYETLLSWWLADAFDGDPNVTFWTPPSGEALFDIDDWWWLLAHGDRMGSRGGMGFIGPAAPIARGHQKLFQSCTTSGRRVDWILTGHLHTSLKLERGHANGSMCGYNEYAKFIQARPDAPKQWLFFVHKEHMISHQFELVLGPTPNRVVV